MDLNQTLWSFEVGLACTVCRFTPCKKLKGQLRRETRAMPAPLVLYKFLLIKSI